MKSYRMPRFVKGERAKAEDLQDLSDAVDELRRARAAGGLSRGTAGGVADLRPRKWLAKIVASGVISSKTYYSWQAVYETAAGVYASFDLSFSGKYNAESPAYERNGNTAVPTNTIVEMEWDPTTAAARFFYTTPAAASSLVYPVKAPAGGIAAMSGSTPGSATCTKYVWSGGSLTATGTTLTVKNPYTTAVGANKFAWAVDWEGATWIATEAC